MASAHWSLNATSKRSHFTHRTNHWLLCSVSEWQKQVNECVCFFSAGLQWIFVHFDGSRPNIRDDATTSPLDSTDRHICILCTFGSLWIEFRNTHIHYNCVCILALEFRRSLSRHFFLFGIIFRRFRRCLRRSANAEETRCLLFGWCGRYSRAYRRTRRTTTIRNTDRDDENARRKSSMMTMSLCKQTTRDLFKYVWQCVCDRWMAAVCDEDKLHD